MAILLMTPVAPALPQRLIGALQLAGAAPTDLIGPIVVYRGDDAAYLLIVTNDAGARVDLTSATIEAQIKPTAGAADPPTISAAVGHGIDLLDQTEPDTAGMALIQFSGAQQDVSPGLYALDVVVVLSGRRTHVITPRDYTIAPVVNGPP